MDGARGAPRQPGPRLPRVQRPPDHARRHDRRREFDYAPADGGASDAARRIVRRAGRSARQAPRWPRGFALAWGDRADGSDTESTAAREAARRAAVPASAGRCLPILPVPRARPTRHRNCRWPHRFRVHRHRVPGTGNDRMVPESAPVRVGGRPARPRCQLPDDDPLELRATRCGVAAVLPRSLSAVSTLVPRRPHPRRHPGYPR